ncbi:MAG: sigma-54 factor interaction domain-containing protein, partial [Gemmatimonadetes bacterium]|nr:sigma-54 factor interaction domain-containing protein [Gemmatimonadota bacterium]
MKIGVCHSEGFRSQVEEATDDPNEQPTMGIRSQSPIVARLLQQAAKIAKTDKSVLLLGETGVGKGLLAKTIHRHSLRRHEEFVKVNCAGMERGLIRSELFGHEKGAFT